MWVFDLAGYGNTPVRVEGNVTLVGGWSDRVFESVERIRAGESIMEQIKNYTK
jgi:hypothetical protein